MLCTNNSFLETVQNKKFVIVHVNIHQVFIVPINKFTVNLRFSRTLIIKCLIVRQFSKEKSLINQCLESTTSLLIFFILLIWMYYFKLTWITKIKRHVSLELKNLFYYSVWIWSNHVFVTTWLCHIYFFIFTQYYTCDQMYRHKSYRFYEGKQVIFKIKLAAKWG